MKPIELTIAGLHSFREKQTIRFDELCDGGVFGIFGPTGSGKSSILDAITLALYGKVERAANNTYGILNHAEDQLSVSYTFELRNGSGFKRYRVERIYKRTDEHRVKGAIARLVDLEEVPVVLADKASEVNEQVHELLGLTIDDFTRAVVLPQGKFAEFLSLKGSERRQMLQRLFHLEQYGDELLRKLRSRLGKAKAASGETEAEQAGLGDASKKALKEAEAEYASSSSLLDKRITERNQLRDQLEQKRKIWELQKEQAALLQQEKEYESKSSEVEEMKRKLRLAEEAAGLKPYADQLRSAEARLAKMRGQEKKWSAELEKQKAAAETAAEIYEKARREKEMAEPALAVKKEQLTRLLETEKERDRCKMEAKRLEEELHDLKRRNEQAKKEFEHAGQQLQKARARQQEIRRELQENTVSSAYRRSLQSAADLHKELGSAEERVKEAADLLKQLNEQVSVKEGEIQTRSAAREKEKEKLSALYHGLHRLYGRTGDLKSKIEQTLGARQQEAAALRQLLDQEKTRQIARQLSASLKSGEPCPVCGSTHHAGPLHIEPGQADSGSLERLEKEIEQQRDNLQSAGILMVKMEELSSSLTEDFPSIHVNTYEESAASLEKAGESDVTELKALDQDLLYLRERASAAAKQLNALLSEEQQASLTMDRLNQDRTEVKARLQELREKTDVYKAQWAERHADFQAEEMPALLKAVDEKDAASDVLQTKYNKSVEYIEQQENIKQNAQTKLSELDRSLILTAEKRQAAEEKLLEKEQLLEKEAPNGPIPLQLEQIQKQLEDLGRREKEQRRRHEEAGRLLQQAEKESAAASKGLQEAKENADHAAGSWEEQLGRTSLHSAEEADRLLMSDAEKKKMAEAVETFMDHWKQCKADLKRISGLIGGQAISEEDWDQVNAASAETEKAVSEAQGLKGAAAKALELMKEKHERFEELEKLRIELSEKIGDLEKLQSVFKGNSFVEYIAEEQLNHVARDASERLGLLTRQRYAIEVDSQGGFIMRDDANGGVRRPVSSLSGGETFLTSLALALSLSAQIQLRGQYPLQFFFLDEGFGTLDTDLLDTVVTALEKLHSDNLSVGVISHVPELRARLARKLVVTPADSAGKGTEVALEIL
ncbi:AAA family ATPase [Bacillus mangrovi]|uniref:Nuclease SbcCD subunit C n=1 Tax=Metabacillus mangrovi TaxID=1491830 RepID=A0A7X2V4F1_9BACI|nr:AAA family ATPase [Metabacillus mangrovi]MTH53325.1 AAA family ATPase [Metabacillus mangrovi]